MISRAGAFALLCEYTQSTSLIKHALSVECAMRWYGRHFNVPGDELELWGMTGLVHDFDYEKFPEEHPYKGNRILIELGYPLELTTAVMGHATFTNVARDSLMAKALFACDELCGLVTASVYVRPDRSILTLEAKSVEKKMKDKAFARGCNRDDIRLGAEELAIPLTQHIQNVVTAMRESADLLELRGNPPTPA